jgi:hypothetical protein
MEDESKVISTGIPFKSTFINEPEKLIKAYQNTYGKGLNPESYSDIVKLADCLVNSFTDTFELDCVRARKFVTELKDAIKNATI